jgi:hypothetical protein
MSIYRCPKAIAILVMRYGQLWDSSPSLGGIGVRLGDKPSQKQFWFPQISHYPITHGLHFGIASLAVPIDRPSDA